MLYTKKPVPLDATTGRAGIMIFVFGSNLSGIHGAGAALYAKRNFGAVQGVGSGMTGECYALPTKGLGITHMPLTEIRKHVYSFICYARNHSSTDFKITQVGCGLSGFTPADIAPMFRRASWLKNCYFDTAWEDHLSRHTLFWGTL